MGDDGFGVTAAQALEAENLGDNVKVVIGLTADLGMIGHFLESDLVIFLDAIDAEAEPGAIFRFHPDEAGITGLRSNNIHGMGVSYLLTSARLKGANPEVIVFAVQVASVVPRDRELSPAVEAAVKRVVEMVAEEIARRQKEWQKGAAALVNSSAHDPISRKSSP